ncbi:MAG TPA: hypothetical protein VG317_12905 [Pseudonocardiaceae bacterium]|nr:hypothetical protein [Pseudonocardiaceae bacterium]
MFGGPDRYIKDLGGFDSIIDAHRHLRITGEQRLRFVEFVRGGGQGRASRRRAVPRGTAVTRRVRHPGGQQNSHATTDAEPHPLREMPHWDWDPPK